MMAFLRLRPRAALTLVILLATTRCAEPPAPRPIATRPAGPANPAARLSAQPPAQVPAQMPPGASRAQPLPDGTAAGQDAKPVPFNDPPAAPDTPLCGRQAQESNAIGAALQGQRVAASGICAGFACYDPLTATYIGVDGYRHVCR